MSGKGTSKRGGKKAADGSSGADRGDEPRGRMERREYETALRDLHVELVAMQEWVRGSGAKVCVVFEGRDTAGKGGTRQEPGYCRPPARPAHPIPTPF